MPFGQRDRSSSWQRRSGPGARLVVARPVLLSPDRIEIAPQRLRQIGASRDPASTRCVSHQT